MNTLIEKQKNLLDNTKDCNSNQTFTDDDYIKLSNNAVDEVRRLCSNLSLWNICMSKNGIDIFEKNSDIHTNSESMLLAIITLPCSMQKIEKLISPWNEYRLKWDLMLENVEIIQKWSEEEVYLVRHFVKKLFIISARESIDVVKVARRANQTVFGSTGVLHADYPPSKNYVRTHQYLSGYMLQPCESNSSYTKFHMLFHADLNLSGPKILTNMITKLKPRLMCQKLENLKKAINIFDI